ncbi:hypothetical protein PQQ51_28985 [Paraburkholderia xenovorans]|uniref:tetratricopeptide repeat protein n=1 Tax=Paraburkholderia xenovorans TaxID=36873 RepID=UPI0038BBB689
MRKRSVQTSGDIPSTSIFLPSERESFATGVPPTTCAISGPAPANIDTLIARANSFFSEKNLSKAIGEYERVLCLQPQNVHALHCAGLASLLNGQPERAREFLSRALSAAPERADILEQCGLLAAMSKDWLVAEDFYRRAIRALGSTVTLHRNLADCLHASERDSEAAEHYSKVLELEPGFHHALHSLARISEKRGKYNDAADYRLRAWRSNSASLQDGLDLITALVRAEREEETDEALRQLSSRFPNDAEALGFISGVLNSNDRYTDGLRLAREGLQTDPQNPLLNYNAARALWMVGRPRECFPYAMEAARLWPDNAGTSVQYFVSCVQLVLGDFEEGWRRHKSFYTYPSLSRQLVRPDFPEWNGEPLAGCRFLYVLHQGFGDQIQFLRFTEWLNERGATVDVLVDPAIAGVAASMASVRTVYSYPNVPGGPYEYWSHMMRIPEYMKLNVSMLPVAMPYLVVTQEKREHWRTYIDASAQCPVVAKARRVGLVWKGSPNTATDRFRSIRLQVLRPLFELPSITWFSVQKDDAENESQSLAGEFSVHILGPLSEDFTDTLAILETLDLLITVDSSTAHLAGAAGLPVWVLLPAYSEWRWLADRTDSPWYPSMRLFRQRELGKWDDVIGEVRDALSVR